MRENPKPSELYQHFKGKLYQIVAIAIHSETREELVIYQALYGTFQVYARPLSMFVSKVDEEKYPEYAGKYRFTKINLEELSEKNEEVKGYQVGLEAGISEKPEYAGLKTKAATQTEAAGTLPVHKDTEEESLGGNIVDDSQDVEIKPELLLFLDAKGYEEKLNTLLLIKNKLDQEMINAIAISLDVEISEGTIAERFEAIKTCLLTKEKYECSRRLN